jgi:nucleoside-diphosphate-sugar epimerase
LLHRVLGWEPSISLAQGLRPTYGWISEQVAPAERKPLVMAD